MRLSPQEDLLIERLGIRLGGEARPLSKTAVVEEALRRYLPVIDEAAAFVQRSRPAEEHGDAQGRRFQIDQNVLSGLVAITEAHGWTQLVIVQQALLALDLATTERGGMAPSPDPC